jgi:hypothetical protein
MVPSLPPALPMPGMFWKALGWLMDPESPLRIQPRFNYELVRWLARFRAYADELVLAVNVPTTVEDDCIDLAELTADLRAKPNAWNEYAQVLLSSNEFLYVH